MKYLLSILLSLLLFNSRAQQAKEEIINFYFVARIPTVEGCAGIESLDESRGCFLQQVTHYVNRGFNYPKEAANTIGDLKIYVSFVVEKDASISNVQVARGAQDAYSVEKNGNKAAEAAALLDAEAIRIVSSLQMRTPAYLEEKPVRMSFTVAINAKSN